MILSFIGLVILIGGNSIRHRSVGKLAPILWDILTVVVSIATTILFYRDIINKSLDLGPIPFILLIGYGLLSFFFLALLPGKKQQDVHSVSDANDWKLKETWEDYAGPDYDAIHTYCSVAFDDSGKTFYYRTRNPELQIGDFVYVPVGASYKKRMGRVVEMKNYVGRYAPYPLERTKYISGKVDV